jgi:ribosomal protein S26
MIQGVSTQGVFGEYAIFKQKGRGFKMTEKKNLLEQEIMKYAKNNELSCVTAFEIAEKMNVPAQDIGEAADGLKIRLVKCQLGLFGYKPDKKTVKPLETVSSELKSSIINSLESGKLSCIKAWEIASQLKIQRFSVSCACEALGIKIKECQLGAF